MAAGDVTVFDIAKQYILDGTIDLSADTLKLMLVSNASITANTATPQKTDFTEVITTGTSYTGPITMTKAVSDNGGTGAKFDFTNDINLAQDGSGPTNIRYGVVYAEEATNDEALCFVDIGAGSDVSLVDGSLTITWASTGIFTID